MDNSALKKMILYNVTLTLEPEIHDAWLAWMKDSHLAAVMATGIFTEYRLNRLLVPENPDHVTYTVQYLCENLDRLEEYKTKYAPALQADGIQRFGNKMLAFRTVMEIVKEV